MQPRFDIMAVDPAAYRAMAEVERYLHQTSLEKPLIHIVTINSWNRLSVAARATAGMYQSKQA